MFSGSHTTVRTIAVVLGIGLMAPMALAIGPDVIYTEITTHSSGLVPGALDAGGSPVVTNWLAIEDIAVRHDGGEWMIKGRTTQALTNDSILVLGSGLSGTMFAQDGQPIQGGAANELYDFFDSPFPAAWDSAGNMAFSCRAKGGVAGNAEKIIKVVGGVHTIVIQQGMPALGLIDIPANPSGDELFGNSMNSVYLLDDGRVSFYNTPITNLSSFRYPALFRDQQAFKQSGVTPIGAEIWDSFVLDGHGGTPDGAHWYAMGDTENPNTAIDNILAVNDTIVIQEGSPVAGPGTPIMSSIFATRMVSNGDWFARGAESSGADWAVRNGVLMAKTGDLIAGGEHWGDIFSGFVGDRLGNWLLTGNTDIGDATMDTVMVYNGSTILMREGDPIDLDNNGFFDDDVFLNSFQPNDMFLTDTGLVFFLATLRNGAGTGIGDAFLRLQVPEPATLAALTLGFVLLRPRRRQMQR